MLDSMEFAILACCVAIAGAWVLCGGLLLLFGETPGHLALGAAQAITGLGIGAAWFATDSIWIIAGVTMAASIATTFWSNG